MDWKKWRKEVLISFMLVTPFFVLIAVFELRTIEFLALGIVGVFVASIASGSIIYWGDQVRRRRLKGLRRGE
jgi:hypothetical protein